jgi:hypothetical protein
LVLVRTSASSASSKNVADDSWRRPTDWSDASPFSMILGRIAGMPFYDDLGVGGSGHQNEEPMPSVAVASQQELPPRTPKVTRAARVGT